MRHLAVLLLCGLGVGCGRAYYRQDADRETYTAIAERTGDPRWSLPRLELDTPPESRLHDPFARDFPPMPPDDPAAAVYLHRVDQGRIKGSKKWWKYGSSPFIEDPAWQALLPWDDQGQLVLSPDRAIELGVLNSREYQTALESVYSTALILTLERFEFALRWFARNGTFFSHFGAGSRDNESNVLSTRSNLGFNRDLATGGQLLVDFANSFVFEFAGPYQTVTQSNLVINFVQPLLRRAWRDVRLEPLTQSERNVLYAVRDFARFRKQYTFEVLSGYLSQLLQVQNLRNQEVNLANLEQSLRLHEAQFARGVISIVQLDQVYLRYQQSRVDVINTRTTLENSLDAYKVLLGLPPSLPVRLDETLLVPFQLTDPVLDRLQEELEQFSARYRELDAAPPLVELREGYRRLRGFQDRTKKQVQQVAEELQRWGRQLQEEQDDDEAQARRTRALYREISKDLPLLEKSLDELVESTDKAAAALMPDKLTEGWEELQNRIRRSGELTAQLGIVQTQVRVYLIQLPRVSWAQDEAVRYARENRLDLMNVRGRVVDAWRRIHVTADGLQADLNLRFNADIATLPGRDNPADFRAAASRYTVGLEFDGPLNRQAERNVYRASLIAYQRARRDFMALDDNITLAVRRDLRNLQNLRLNFEIARQALISAARNVEASREELRQQDRAAADSATTLNILNALENVLTTKTQLISSYLSYETARLQLLLDLEALQLDARGIPTDEHRTASQSSGLDGQPAADHPYQSAEPAGKP